MKKRWLWIGLAAVVVVAIVAVGAMRGGSGGKVERVQFAEVKSQTITARVRAPGKIEPRTQVKVSADVAGKIVDLAVSEGDAVKKGQLMLQLDDVQYRALYDQAEAAFSSANARLVEAQSSLKLTEANHARQRALWNDNLLSEAEWEQATKTYESAKAAEATAREEVARARSARVAAQDNLRKCRFVAPFDGIVSELNVEEGEIVVIGTMNNPGTQILTVSDLSRMLVKADVDETDVVNVRLGQKSKITVDALLDTTFAGTVVEIGNTAKRSMTAVSEGQTNFEVKVVFDLSVAEIRPGMTADVEVETASHEGAIGVPIQAVVTRTPKELEPPRKGRKKASSDAIAAGNGVQQEGEAETLEKDRERTGVFVNRNGTAEFVEVRTGIASETTIEVFGTIQAGDQVVSGPYKALRELKPGTKLKAAAERDQRKPS
jgi:HlyD family secretion protein